MPTEPTPRLGTSPLSPRITRYPIAGFNYGVHAGEQCDQCANPAELVLVEGSFRGGQTMAICTECQPFYEADLVPTVLRVKSHRAGDKLKVLLSVDRLEYYYDNPFTGGGNFIIVPRWLAIAATHSIKSVGTTRLRPEQMGRCIDSTPAFTAGS